VNIVKTVNGKRKLPQIVVALHPPCGFPCRLNGRQKQGDQHANDRNNDEKFDWERFPIRGGNAVAIFLKQHPASLLIAATYVHKNQKHARFRGQKTGFYLPIPA